MGEQSGDGLESMHESLASRFALTLIACKRHKFNLRKAVATRPCRQNLPLLPSKTFSEPITLLRIQVLWATCQPLSLGAALPNEVSPTTTQVRFRIGLRSVAVQTTGSPIYQPVPEKKNESSQRFLIQPPREALCTPCPFVGQSDEDHEAAICSRRKKRPSSTA